MVPDPASVHPGILQAIKFLEDEYRSNFALPLIARMVGMSKRVIEEDPYCPLTQIASRVGFKDNAHFGKTFMKVVGETPSSYRRTV